LSEDLIKIYKNIIDNIFNKSKNILSEIFIKKLIKKAEKISSADGKALLNGIDFQEDELQILNVLKNFEKDKANYTADVVSNEINSILQLIHKALSMLVGRNKSSEILKGALVDTMDENKETLKKLELGKDISELLPEFIK